MEEYIADICVIEDDPSQRVLLARRLRRWGYSVVEAADGASGTRQVYEHRPRVLICDVMLPDIEGIQVCRQVRADPTLEGTYIVLATAYDRPNGKQRALNAGADDYLQKPYDMNELKARIRNGLRFSRLQERLRRAASTDGLTGLWNHTQFREMLDREFLRSRRYGGSVTLLMIDLDHFKAVNDTYGHEIGNRVLKLTARHLRTSVRETDTVARYGGEEFAIICPETSMDEATMLAERIRRKFPARVRVPDLGDLEIRASIGVRRGQTMRAWPRSRI